MWRTVLLVVFFGVCRCQYWWVRSGVQGSPLTSQSCTCPSIYSDWEDNDECECVQWYQCDNETKRISQDGAGIIGFKAGGSNGECPTKEHYCCKVPHSDRPKPIRGTNSKPQTGKPVDAKPTAPLECGQRDTKLTSSFFQFKIQGEDIPTVAGEFPWMLMLYVVERGVGEIPDVPFYVCGASLIQPNIALTAAHCVNGRLDDDLVVRGGEWNNDNNGEVDSVVQDRRGIEIFIHQDYNAEIPRHDIALIKLDSPMEITKFVNVICLPEKGVNFDSKRCIATGWGLDADDETGKEQKELRKIELPIIRRSVCEKQLKQEIARTGYPGAGSWKLEQGFMCAGGELGKDSCSGDGGGPLMCKDPSIGNKFVQVGITAWGLKPCGRKNIPGVYSDVAQYRDWIFATILAIEDE